MISRTTKTVCIGWTLLTVAGCTELLAQPAPRLDSISATWFQRGTTNDITLRGDALSGLRELLLTGQGVTATLQTNVGTETMLEGSAGGLFSGQADAGKSVQVRVAIHDKAALGPREIRAAGPLGVSNPLVLQISDIREFQERTPNNQVADAQWVELPGAISGVISSGAESDFHRFKARKGQKWIFDLQANRTGSPLDASMELLNSSGISLAKSEDVHGLDPFIEYTPAEDGEFVIQIRDLRYQGGGDYRYRLVAGPFPYIDYLFPFGGRRGSTIQVGMKGRNLEGSERISLRIAPDAPAGRQDVRAHTSRGYSNPLPFEAGDLAELLENEPNDANDKAGSVGFPIVVNGRINKTSDVDVFRFKSPADQPVLIEVQARRFGSPLDALLTLMDTKGTVIQRNDDTDGPDARIQFDAKKETEYLVSIRDLTDRGGDPFGYRLTLKRPDTTPDFGVRMIGGRVRIARGGSVPVRCEVDRRNGFDGLIRVSAENLPQGVTAAPLTFGPVTAFGWMVLTASQSSEPGYRPLKLVASAERNGKALIREVQPQEQSWLTVLESSQFSIDVAPASLVADQNQTVTLDVAITRRDGFTGEVKVNLEEIPGIKASTLTVEPGKSRGKLDLEVRYDAEVGTRPLMIRGDASVEGVGFSVHTPAPVQLTTHRIAMFLTAMLPGSPFFRTDPVKLSAVALPEGTDSQANRTEFVVKVERRNMTNEVALLVEGLPKGVTATTTNIPPGATEASIRLLVTDKAETGKDHTFNIVGTATHGDRIWRQKTQPVTLKIEAPEKDAAQPAPVQSTASK